MHEDVHFTALPYRGVSRSIYQKAGMVGPAFSSRVRSLMAGLGDGIALYTQYIGVVDRWCICISYLQAGSGFLKRGINISYYYHTVLLILLLSF